MSEPETVKAIEVVATVHLGSRINKLHPGEHVLVMSDDPTVAPHIAAGRLVPVARSDA